MQRAAWVGLVQREAKLGEQNRFIYDKERGIWREEGAEVPPDAGPLPPPPTHARASPAAAAAPGLPPAGALPACSWVTDQRASRLHAWGTESHAQDVQHPLVSLILYDVCGAFTLRIDDIEELVALVCRAALRRGSALRRRAPRQQRRAPRSRRAAHRRRLALRQHHGRRRQQASPLPPSLHTCIDKCTPQPAWRSEAQQAPTSQQLSRCTPALLLVLQAPGMCIHGKTNGWCACACRAPSQGAAALPPLVPFAPGGAAQRPPAFFRPAAHASHAAPAAPSPFAAAAAAGGDAQQPHAAPEDGAAAGVPSQQPDLATPAAPPLGQHSRKGSFSQYLSPPTSTNSLAGALPSPAQRAPSATRFALGASARLGQGGAAGDGAAQGVGGGGLPSDEAQAADPAAGYSGEQMAMGQDYYTSYSAVLGGLPGEQRGAQDPFSSGALAGGYGQGGRGAEPGQDVLPEGDANGTAVLFAQSADEMTELEL